jgi:hypothetical protein
MRNEEGGKEDGVSRGGRYGRKLIERDGKEEGEKKNTLLCLSA